jgi:hypothetical protein
MTRSSKIIPRTVQCLVLLTLLTLPSRTCVTTAAAARTVGFALPRPSFAIQPTATLSVNDAAQAQNLSPTTACQVDGGPPACKDGDGGGSCDSWERAQRI